jgi:hypothetical protein
VPYQDYGPIPIIAYYRGVGIEDQQDEERIKTIVEREIDHVLDTLNTIPKLYAFARSSLNSPEARQLAAGKIRASWEIAVEERRERPQGITLDQVRAAVCGLGNQNWRSPFHFGSSLDVPPAPGAPKPASRPRQLTEQERGRPIR